MRSIWFCFISPLSSKVVAWLGVWHCWSVTLLLYSEWNIRWLTPLPISMQNHSGNNSVVPGRVSPPPPPSTTWHHGPCQYLPRDSLLLNKSNKWKNFGALENICVCVCVPVHVCQCACVCMYVCVCVYVGGCGCGRLQYCVPISFPRFQVYILLTL